MQLREYGSSHYERFKQLTRDQEKQVALQKQMDVILFMLLTLLHLKKDVSNLKRKRISINTSCRTL